jgi:DNA mismatch repair protein MSH6
VNYIESDDEGEDDDEEIFRRKPSRQRSVKRRRTDVESEDEFKAEAAEGGDSENGMWQPRRAFMGSC